MYAPTLHLELTSISQLTIFPEKPLHFPKKSVVDDHFKYFTLGDKRSMGLKVFLKRKRGGMLGKEHVEKTGICGKKMMGDINCEDW